MTETIRKKGVRIFEGPIMDWASRAHPALPAIMWIPTLLASFAFGIYKGAPWWISALVAVGGFFLWTLFEYILHRWIFHFVPKKPEQRTSYYRVHQVHHDYSEWDRLVAPPLMSLSLAAIFIALFYITVGPLWMWPLLSGFIVGYLVYDYSHFFMHFGTPKTNYGKRLRRRHHQHHTTYPDRWFGVSTSFWDFVFRTHVDPKNRPDMPEPIEWNPHIYPDK